MMNFSLTIDDGPSKNTLKKLEFFDFHNISAIWFCLGNNLEKYPEIAVELIQKGHIVGNHSYNHPFFSEIGFEECKDQIIRTEKIIDRLYKKAKTKRPAKLFRFPYGDQGHFENGEPSTKPERLFCKERLREFLKELEFRSVPFSEVEYNGAYGNQSEDADWLWSYDIQEWAIGHKRGLQLNFEKVKENLHTYLKNYDRNKAQVILIHDNERTAQFFSELMQMFIGAGIVFTLPRL